MEACIIFPHQLFDEHPGLKVGRPVWLVEDGLYFGVDPHQPLHLHKHKLMLHRASMKAYAERLTARGHVVHYMEAKPKETIDQQLPKWLPKKIRRLWVADPTDYLIERRLRRYADRHQVELTLLPSPMFLTPPEWFHPWFDGRTRYFMADFYVAQRKRLKLLLNPDGTPKGGQWSFDAENRKRWPPRQKPPPHVTARPNPFVDESSRYVNQRFPENPGDTQDFWFPVTHDEARLSLTHFLQHRFRGFGDFEDAISREHLVLHHSVLTPALNIGLLTPREVVDQSMAFAAAHHVPLNDLEGWLRQIIGWREFMRIVYVREGVRQRTANFWGHRRKLDARWYTGNTGLTPVDAVIKRVVKYAYCHHIERLMVLGNAMLLSETDPDDVYRWFMELFIDAYDWVMVPNVYGMSQFADGGLLATKPYISGSNYIKKMSDFPPGPWCELWDSLFWRFIGKHRDFFSRQPRLSMMVRTLDKISPEKKSRMETVARQSSL